MTLNGDPATPDRYRSISAINLTTLDYRTPHGLFEGRTGNIYIVTSDFGTELAIALVHDSLPAFTWQSLGSHPIEVGWSLGAYALQLTHAVSRATHRLVPGVIGTGDGYATLDCLAVAGNVNAIALGRVGTAGSDFNDYDGWAVSAVDRPSQSFVETRSRGARITIRPAQDPVN